MEIHNLFGLIVKRSFHLVNNALMSLSKPSNENEQHLVRFVKCDNNGCSIVSHVWLTGFLGRTTKFHFSFFISVQWDKKLRGSLICH